MPQILGKRIIYPGGSVGKLCGERRITIIVALQQFIVKWFSSGGVRLLVGW